MAQPDPLDAQARELERLMPQLARRLFTLHPGDPAAELTVTQVRVCSVLQSGPAAMSAVGEELGISMSAVTQIADRLERSGFVERIPGDEDRRMKRLVLTDHGREVMGARHQRRVGRVSAVLKGLSPERRVDVLAALNDLLAASASPP
jgi:DNA-binding MarR family transcriptional regulator